MMERIRRIMKFLKTYKKLLILVIFPILLSVMPIVSRTKTALCAYVVILMCVFWLTMALPVGITSLLPVIFFPLFDVISSKAVCMGYFQDIVMLFFGSLVVASAIEQTKLHERIALRLLTVIGTEPKWLMLGFMCMTSFISLWISNAAATAIMLPIVISVVKELIKNDTRYHEVDSSKEFEVTSVTTTKSNVTVNINEENYISSIKENNDGKVIEYNESDIYKTENARKLATALILSCGYAAIIGGVGTLVGTEPNLLFKGYMNNNYPNIPINFLTFTLFGFPITVLLLILSWIWLTIKWLPKSICKCNKKIAVEVPKTDFKKILVDRYNGLGSLTWGEGCVGVIFIMLIILWVTRDFGAVPGWSYFFNRKYVTDTTPAILAVILLFVCPKENVFKGHAYKHLIDWNELQKVFPWDIILLTGGALVMAQGFDESGLSLSIGTYLKSLASVNKELTLFIIIMIGIGTSEFASNTSDAAILLPIIDSLAKQHNTSPVYFLLPLSLSVTLAFMVPMGTPNMTIIYSIGKLKLKDMLVTGFVMNILGFLVLLLASNTWLYWIFDINNVNFTLLKNSTFLNTTTF